MLCRWASMGVGYFNPHPQHEGACARGCFTCSHWQGRFLSDQVACEHRGRVQVIGQPLNGCAYWQRDRAATTSRIRADLVCLKLAPTHEKTR
jgi:hypothetical protein